MTWHVSDKHDPPNHVLGAYGGVDFFPERPSQLVDHVDTPSYRSHGCPSIATAAARIEPELDSTKATAVT
jgi:hypothetical protein